MQQKRQTALVPRSTIEITEGPPPRPPFPILVNETKQPTDLRRRIVVLTHSTMAIAIIEVNIKTPGNGGVIVVITIAAVTNQLLCHRRVLRGINEDVKTTTI